VRALRALLVVLLLALGVAPAAAAAPAAGATTRTSVDVVASGLDSPRHLAFGSRGDLFVAESGRGGSGPCFIGGEGPACMGASGAVTKVDRRGRQSRIAEGLASYANTPGDANAIGPHGITVLGADRVFVTNGGPTEPKDESGATISRDTLAAQNPAADLFGRLLRIKHHGRIRNVADLWAFERDVNPDAAVGNPAIDSNPVDVLFDRGRFVVADAGGNAVDVVSRRGRVRNLAVFPNRPVPNPFGGPDVPMQAVPTSVVEGPDGQYYVSQLTGFPFPPGGANVFRVNPRTGAVSVFASGFTNIMDLAFGRHGTLYVLEIDHDGLLGGSTDGGLFAVSRDGQQRQIALAPGTLTMPGGIAVGKDGLYVTNNSGSPGGGQVLRIRAR
jgi:sugar lactone lactonase YvrE